MSIQTYRIPQASVSVLERDGRKYADISGIELWLRRTAASFQEQDAPEIAITTINALADAIATKETP